MKIRFWSSAMIASVTFGTLAGFLTPYEALGAQGADDQRRILLLILWTSGVMAVCFGAAGLLATVTPIGFRDVAEKGSVVAAVEARHEAGRSSGDRFFNFAGWVLTTGAFLLVIYFGVWASGG